MVKNKGNIVFLIINKDNQVLYCILTFIYIYIYSKSNLSLVLLFYNISLIFTKIINIIRVYNYT